MAYMASAPRRKETASGQISDIFGMNSVLSAAVRRAGSLILYGIAKMSATTPLIIRLTGFTWHSQTGFRWLNWANDSFPWYFPSPELPTPPNGRLEFA